MKRDSDPNLRVIQHMDMDSTSPTAEAATGLHKIAQQGDLLLMVVLAASTLGAFAIGQLYASWGFVPGVVVGLLLALGAAAFAVARGSTLSMFVLTAVNAGMVVMHIQLGRGTLEFHFGIFALLGLVLAFRDWRVVVATAGIFAVHHFLFDRLQAAGFGVFCTPEPDVLKIIKHAAYVVIQTGVEIVLAVQLRRGAVEQAEMVRLVQEVKRGDALNLNVEGVPTSAPVATALKGVIGSMAQAVSRVTEATQSIEVATKEIAAGNLDLSRRTESQASCLQQTAASMEQLSGTVRLSAETSGKASRQAAESAAAAAATGQTVQAVLARMEDIAGSSRKIADFTGLIDGIAFQTNILALNAAVEAARAGEQGRGFAVVAAEVRNLAGRSAEAAREIKSLTGQVVSDIDSSAQMAAQAGDAMRALVTQVQGAAALIDDVSHTAQEQAGRIAQVGQAVAEIDGITQQNAALVEEASAAAESLRQQASRLVSSVQVFRLA